MSDKTINAIDEALSEGNRPDNPEHNIDAYTVTVKFEDVPIGVLFYTNDTEWTFPTLYRKGLRASISLAHQTPSEYMQTTDDADPTRFRINNAGFAGDDVKIRPTTKDQLTHNIDESPHRCFDHEAYDRDEILRMFRERGVLSIKDVDKSLFKPAKFKNVPEGSLVSWFSSEKYWTDLSIKLGKTNLTLFDSGDEQVVNEANYSQYLDANCWYSDPLNKSDIDSIDESPEPHQDDPNTYTEVTDFEHVQLNQNFLFQDCIWLKDDTDSAVSKVDGRRESFGQNCVVKVVGTSKSNMSGIDERRI